MKPAAQQPDLEARLAELHEASYGWACACCDWNETDAEDVLQTTYLKVITGRARFDGRSEFRTWLFGVIRFTAREHARRSRSLRRRVDRLAEERAAEASAGAGRSVAHPSDPAVAAERSRILRRALGRLPDRQREVLHLVFYQDLTLREAAEVMDVSIGSVRVHYDRGKRKLRALLEQEPGGGDL